jgi:hypothetical protein
MHELKEKIRGFKIRKASSKLDFASSFSHDAGDVTEPQRPSLLLL